jgi:hypothetical protein
MTNFEQLPKDLYYIKFSSSCSIRDAYKK